MGGRGPRRPRPRSRPISDSRQVGLPSSRIRNMRPVASPARLRRFRAYAPLPSTGQRVESCVESSANRTAASSTHPDRRPQAPGIPRVRLGRRRLLDEGRIVTRRAVGRIHALESRLDEAGSTATVGIAHTRWATHGDRPKTTPIRTCRATAGSPWSTTASSRITGRCARSSSNRAPAASPRRTPRCSPS